MYQVRVKKFEKKNWKVVAEFETFKEAHIFAIRLDMKNRKSLDTMYDNIDIKWCSDLVNRTYTRFMIA